MDFDEWQVERLRHALNSYTALKAVNGRLLPWKAAYSHILKWQVRRLDRYPRRRHPDVREEAIRRFAAGEQRLEADKLDDLMNFLIEAGVLTASDMNKDDLVKARGIAVHDALANVRTSFDRLDRSGAARRVLEEFSEVIELRVVKQPLQTLRYVEERCRIFDSAATTLQPGRKDAGLQAQFIRRGFAVGLTKARAINVFVWGPDDDDHRHYVQMPSAPESETSLVMLRTGDIDESTQEARREDILNFEPSVSEDRRSQASPEAEPN